MTLSELFIRRPVMSGLLTVTLVVFGLLSYRQLPVSDLPTVDFPTITVSASLPGASAETMAASVATPLEKQLSTIASIDSMTSTSSQGVTQITLQFKLDRDIDNAAQDVQAALTAAVRQLPSEMEQPPSFRKVNPADQSIYLLALSSETLPMSTVDEYAQTALAQRLSMVQGVAQVAVFGSQKYAVRIQLDPARLASRGIGIDEVQQSVAQQSVNLPVGRLQGPTRIYTLDANGQFRNAAEFGGLIVAYRNGAPVRLHDLGRVLDSVQDDSSRAQFNGKPAVVLAIQRQPGSNAVQVVDAVKAQVETLSSGLPQGLKLQTVFDRSQSVRSSFHDVQVTLALALALVVLVIFLFLRSAKATAIPAIALPLSLLGTMPVIYLMGFSLDNVSLMAMTLCVGFVVDDAIVMMENIARHVEMGKTPLTAAFDGSREIGFTIVSMTASLAAVFLPVLFMGGIVGRLLHEFAVTIMVAVVVSGLVSLTLTPLLSSRMMHSGHEQPHAPGTAWFADLYEAARRGYERSLDWALHHRRWVLGGFFLSLVAAAALFVIVPKGFLPTDDTGQLFGLTEGAQDISFESMAAKQAQLAEIIRRNPHVAGRDVVRRRRRLVADAQQRTHGGELEAGEHAAEGRCDRTRAAAATRCGAGYPAVPAGTTGDPHWRRAHQGAVPVRAAGLGHRAPVRVGAPTPGGAARPAAADGRHERPADQLAARRAAARSRSRRRARRDREPDRERALQCVRPAAGRHHLHGDQPVLGHTRSGARVPGFARGSRRAVRARLRRAERAAVRSDPCHR